MKYSQMNLLVGNIFLGLSLMPNFLYNKVALLLIGALFCIGGLVSWRLEMHIERLERRAKHMMLLQGFDLVENLLKQMPNEKPKRRKKR